MPSQALDAVFCAFIHVCTNPGEQESRQERQERMRREEIREDRRRERDRERRLDARDAHGVKKSKLTRDRDRDVSERIALGQAHVGGAGMDPLSISMIYILYAPSSLRSGTLQYGHLYLYATPLSV